MTAASANRIALRYTPETSFGVVPSGSPTMKQLRLTSEGLRGDTGYQASNEIRSDRQVTDLIRTSVGASGPIEAEFSLPTFKDFIALALMADGASLSAAWSTQVDAAALTTVAITQSGNKTTYTKTGAFTSFGGVGGWVRCYGFTDAVNNGMFKVTAKSNNAITVINPSGIANASDGGSISYASQVTNGTTFRSLYMEKQFTDLSNVIRPYTGMAIDRWSLRATAGNNAIITTSFGFLGSRELPFVSSTAGDGSPTAAPTDGVVNAIDHVQAIYTGVDTGAIERDLTEFDFELVNSLRGRQVIGFLGNKSMGEGTVGVTGNANSFFEDTTEADKLANDQASALALVITRGNYSMAIDLPNVKYSGGDQVAGGINQDVTNRLQFTALMNATELKTIRVALFTQP